MAQGLLIVIILIILAVIVWYGTQNTTKDSFAFRIERTDPNWQILPNSLNIAEEEMAKAYMRGDPCLEQEIFNTSIRGFGVGPGLIDSFRYYGVPSI